MNFLLQDQQYKPDIIVLNGWTNIRKVEPQFREVTDEQGTNLLIADADNDPDKRRREILKRKTELGIEFELFLLPNDKDAGNLESLLCQIINPDHQKIFDCFDKYQECLGKNPDYHLPNPKSKIYAYLEALLPGNQSDKIKDSKRDYQNTDHWNLGHSSLEPLKQFIISQIP